MKGGIKVKICGITNLEDALYSVKSGCAALGFVFYKKSPRYIAPDKAKEIIEKLPLEIIKIGIFINAKERTIKNIARLCRLNFLQFHGDESPRLCSRFKGYKIIKAFRIKDSIDWQNVLRYKTFAYLFDTFVKDKPGGTGRSFNWNLFKNSGNIKSLIFLSGGLNAGNVNKAIDVIQPDWVDVCGSVESRPGKKSYKKIKKFIETVKRINK